MTFRAAVVGCGRIGSIRLDLNLSLSLGSCLRLHRSQGSRVVAASDLRLPQLDDFKHRWSITAFYTNFNGEAKQPDSVSVTTAVPERADVVIGLAESGCVKAIGTSYLCSGLPQKLESLVSSISPSH